MSFGLTAPGRESLSSQVHGQLREALMAGRFWPGQRLRIRELAEAMGVSDTPVREAIMQLVREGGLTMRASQSITVVKLSLARYFELREIRFLLEGMAAAKAAPLLKPSDIATLEDLHADLIAAEARGAAEAATIANFRFHFLIYRASQAVDLVGILESCWLRNGPLLKLLYPHAPPTYPGPHQHLAIMDALRRRDGEAAAQAIRDDITEGGARLVDLLRQLEDGRAAIVEDAEGTLSLAFTERAA